MGLKSSVVPQMDFLLPRKILQSHRATKLTGTKNLQVQAALKAAGLVGCTALELERTYDWVPGSAGPRLAELKALGYARKTEAKRENSVVYLFVDPLEGQQ